MSNLDKEKIETLQQELFDAQHKNHELELKLRAYSGLVKQEIVMENNSFVEKHYIDTIKAIKGSFSYKLGRFLTLPFRAVRKCFRLMGKVLRSIKNNGLKATLRKVKNKIVK